MEVNFGVFRLVATDRKEDVEPRVHVPRARSIPERGVVLSGRFLGDPLEVSLKA